MKKRVLIASIGVVILIGIIGLSYNSNNKNIFTQDGFTYAVMLDGENVNIVPAKGMYKVDVACENASGKWLYDEWKLQVVNMSGEEIKCNLDFTSINATYLNTYITGLSGQTQGDGQVVQENGYRYEGKNPNNYVWFNNELWRIIGVFDESSHGQSGQNLVKIIRADSIGGLAWHKSNTNDWTASSLMNLLNGAYLNREDGTDSGYCYGYSSVPSNCDYTNIGINDTYRTMIVNVTWYLGGYSSFDATTDIFYTAERETTVYSGRPTEWEGKIGLMYLSDYGYSVLASSCTRTTNLSSYNTSSCAGESWLYGQSYDWTITPLSSYPNYVFLVNQSGYLTMDFAYYGCSTRPVLYLDSSVYVIDGNGTASDPYIIGM